MVEKENTENKIETLEKLLIQKTQECNQLLETKLSYEKSLQMSQLLLEVYRLNSAYDNIHTNIDLSLTHVAGALRADAVFIIKKEKHGTKIIDSSYQYYDSDEERRNKNFQEFSRFFAIEESFPLIMKTLDTSNLENLKLIDIQNAHLKDSLCRKHNIQRLTFVPIVIDGKVNYYLGAANAQAEKKLEFLKYLSPAYADSLKRILQEQLFHKMAITDNFTGLYDRGYFNQVAEKLERKPNQTVGYILIDLFRLKYVNDNHGHDTGDKYIYSVAKLINKVFGDECHVFRMGGDEFGVICPNKNKDYIELKLTQLNEEIANLVITDRAGNQINSRIDAGYDISEGQVNFEELTHNADLRMNANKNQYYRDNNIERRK